MASAPRAIAPVEESTQDPTAPSGVEVEGLEGTLQSYDVRDTMERRLDALGRCQQVRVRRVRPLAGSIELAIHVRTDGSVSQVDVIDSDLGDVQTERCIQEVTLETRFPEPHGGEADVKWNMSLEPFGRRTPEPMEPERLEERLALGLPDVSERCAMTPRSPRMTVTAYVAPGGKVIAAGASSRALGQDELLACVSEQVATWTLPRPRVLSKVTFQARYRKPLNDAQRRAIRKRFARKRKVERKRKQAEERRRRARQKRKQQQRKRRARQQRSRS